MQESENTLVKRIQGRGTGRGKGKGEGHVFRMLSDGSVFWMLGVAMRKILGMFYINLNR